MTRIVLGCLVALALIGCASKPVSNLPKLNVQSIALVPAVSPALYSLENRNYVVAGLIPLTRYAYQASNAAKTAEFSKAITTPQFSPGRELTDAVVAELRGRGYVVQVLEDVTKGLADPNDLALEKLQFNADAVLHLFISEIGLYSPGSSTHYFPRVNAGGRVFVKARSDYVYDETIYFGVDARSGKNWAIVADEKIAYPDFEFVQKNIDSVRNAFSIGIQAVSKRMAAQIHAVVRE